MKRRTKSPHPSPAVRSGGGSRPYFQKKAVRPVPHSLQRAVISGRPGDRQEREADRAADVVTGRATGSVQIRPGSPPVQRQEEAQAQADEAPVQAQVEQEEEPVQAQEEEGSVQAQAKEEEEPVQAQAGEEEEPVQAQSEEEEEPVQAQAEQEGEEPVQAQAEEEEPVQAQAEEDEEEPVQAQEEEEPVQAQAEEEEEPVQAQAEEEEEPIQARRDESGEPATAAGVQARLREQEGKGASLPEGIRGEMELNFGADFSGVRIHTDDPAIQLTKQLKAVAFTRGRDIYFNRNRFAPASREGRHLLAHELTHTLQQGAVPGRDRGLDGGGPGRVQRKEEGGETIQIRPELLEAIRLARGQIGRVNAKQSTPEGTRVGWERLYEYFFTAFGEKELIHKEVIRTITKAKDGQGNLKDALPSWCGIFVWWAYKKAGIPIPDWKLGVPITGWVVARKPGELPQKGDIAYKGPQHFDHFALVTGVESAADRAGKDYKSILVATVNGNTAGDDNLGGQVQEKWEPIGKWLAFFDPIAKLDMPPAPLVESSVTPDEYDPEADAGSESAPEPLPERPPTDVAELEESEIVSPPDLPAEGETDVPQEPLDPLPAVDTEPEPVVPEAPPVPAPEPVAKVEPLPLTGESDEAMVGFTKASPSQMAATQPTLGTSLTEKMGREQAREAENAPVLVAQTSGRVDEGLTPPGQIPVPGDGQIGDGVTGSDPGKLEADPHQNPGEAPSNEANEKELDKNDGDGFLDWLRSNMQSFMSRIRTRDPNLSTSAGERPNVQLEGEADPGRIDQQREEAHGQLVEQRNTTSETLKNHPGQSNIQARAVSEKKAVSLSTETKSSIQTEQSAAVADYVEAPLPAEVRNAADAKMAPDLHANMGEARDQSATAATERDRNKEAEISKAKTAADKLNQKAEGDQRDIVVRNRKEVAKQQADGIADAYGQVNEFTTDADREQTARRKEIGTKVKESEGKARDKLAEGEKEAEKEKERREKEAADKKKELDKEQKKGSWWDRVKSAIKKAVKAITSAIDAIFTALRNAVKTIIEKAKNAAVGLINAARDWVVDKLNKFRDWAKEKVNKYLKDSFPGLAKRINDGIDSVVDTAIDGVNVVADAAIAGVEALADGLAAALDKVLATFQTALKAAVQIAGAVLTGDLAEALRVAVQAACEIAGIDSQPIFDFIDRAASQLITILKHPMKFLNNVMAAVGSGFRAFWKNIKQHLIKGLIGWLTGALSEVAITLPETFDVKGVFSLVMQILGLTYENIKAKVIKKFPPAATVFNVVEKGFEIVRKLVTEGPMALWEEAKAALANLKEIVLGGIRTYVITTVVKEAITWVLGLLNPAGALVKILKLIFDLIMFLIERFEQIKDFVLSVYNSLTAIASGSIGAASKAVEDALARSLPVVIGLLASLAGLGGIGKTVKGIISKVSTPVGKVVDKIITKIIAFAKKLLKKGKAAGKKAKEAIFKWWTAKSSFKAGDGSTHRIYFKGSGKNSVLMIASTPGPFESFIKNVKIAAGDAKAATAKTNALKTAAAIDTTKKKPGDTVAAVKALVTKLGTYTAVLFGKASTLPKSEIDYKSGTQQGGIIATSMTAKILSKKGPASGEKGSAPTRAKHPVYDALAHRATDSGASSYYVKGHLLNDNTHGPGKYKNLVPLSKTGNSNHEKQVESKVKAAVQSGAIVKYTVSVSGGFHKSSVPKDATLTAAKIPKTWWSTARALRQAENTVPKKLKNEAYRLEFEGSDYSKVKGEKKIVSTEIDNPVDNNLNNYSLW